MTFEEAFEKSKTLTQKPSNEILLQLYSYYKQATEGDAPEKGDFNMFDFVAKAKHDAWATLKGTETEAAKTAYINIVATLLNNEK